MNGTCSVRILGQFLQDCLSGKAVPCEESPKLLFSGTLKLWVDIVSSKITWCWIWHCDSVIVDYSVITDTVRLLCQLHCHHRHLRFWSTSDVRLWFRFMIDILGRCHHIHGGSYNTVLLLCIASLFHGWHILSVAWLACSASLCVCSSKGRQVCRPLI